MADYAASVIVQDVMHGVGHASLAWGTVDLTNYNTTNAEISALANLFGNGRPPRKLILSGISDNGFLGIWDETNKTIKAYYPSIAQTHGHDLSVIGGGTIVADGAFGISAADAFVKVEAGDDIIAKADVGTKGGVVGETLAASAGSEVATDVDVGVFHWMAIG